MADPIQVGTIGLPIRLTLLDDGLVHDPSTASLVQITIDRPGVLANLVRSAPAVTVSVDSQDRVCLEYITVAGDLSVAGTYKVQGFVRDAAGDWPTSVKSFKVYKNILTTPA